MIPTKKARRAVALLAVPALLLTAACGGDNSDDDAGSSDAAVSFPLATVSGSFGEEPDIEVEDDAEESEETVVTVLEEGDGPEVGEGDFMRLSVFASGLDEDEALVNTWQPITPPVEEGAEEEPAEEEDREPVYAAVQAGTEEILPLSVTDPLTGMAEGSRVVVQGSALELIGPQADQLGFGPGDSVVFVYDIVTVIDAQGSAEGEQAASEEGMPEVEAGEAESAGITIPEGADAPTELQQQVLVQGDGPEVAAEQQLIAQYTGVTWEDGEEFDASWDRGGAAKFVIGVGQVVPGWDEALVGKNVGDRVLLVLPPDMAYGGQEDHELAENTLVFVVDILDAI
ncbi:FKBP-type peptidyl-prolyl cis-trans isomerase [Streptomyces sp. ACA25]|uniref:FKBP-type peptidyl-prolyl cis-trans isomerase n=1 Tax=Streptomyces sp. ACA25 TaxID=3022596 RepID=UPI002307566F|nr:FKBP-type peptidyl-prolyl cis-trans isomerase [Streptomyces sp. ACA25]MDB1089016.1 FKBP-type peptidyl-prolyl cis-trans isomerase [Streptomyces sp. ACA25]